MGSSSPVGSPLDSDRGDIKPLSLDGDGTGLGLCGLGILEDDSAVPGIAAVDLFGDASAAPPLTTEEPKPESEKASVGKIAVSVCVWSLGSGIAFAAAMAGLAFVSMYSSGSNAHSLGQIASMLCNGAGIGFVFGLLVGSMWGCVRATDLPRLTATLLGAVTGLVLLVSYHFVQEFLSGLPSGTSVTNMATIGAGAGAAFGLASTSFKEYLEERG